MRQSQLFGRTKKEVPRDEESINARFLIRGGFIHKEMAGVYTFLPLGLRTLNKIENIVRDEMNKANAQEVFMPSLHPKANWQKTGRWDSFDVLFRISSQSKSEYALGPTHEEILYPLLTHYIDSYKDLPVALYQIQTKFRDEPRAKSGLLRGREFRMKDLYSFHATSQDRDAYYEVMRKAYENVFQRVGLHAVETKASGGTFSDISLEFQVPNQFGEDTILLCTHCDIAINIEIAKENTCTRCGGSLSRTKAIEVGNIFPLKTKYAQDFHVSFKDKEGKEQLVAAGCYGIGTSRVMGALVEVFHDGRGILWPQAVAPFRVHLMGFPGKEKESEALYVQLQSKGIEVLYDDRQEVAMGEKFADADLLGIPYRLLASEKTLQKNMVEIKKRASQEPEFIPLQRIEEYIH
ncbi:MAG: hypothetical protein HYW95_01025 [Candidatus Wildermuthbacteria bacterium]|nr:hypothetical protein [Candidatus Wildermuthbacteria bacterium]